MAQAIARATNSLSPVPPPFDYARLAATERRDDPFPHVLVENFVTVPDRAALISDFPAITGPGNVEPGDVPQGPAFDRLILELESDRFRAAIADKFGIVPFVDFGNVGTSSTPDFTDLRMGAGVGIRYVTPFGPLRLDVGVPINRRKGEDSWAIYAGIGQAF